MLSNVLEAFCLGMCVFMCSVFISLHPKSSYRSLQSQEFSPESVGSKNVSNYIHNSSFFTFVPSFVIPLFLMSPAFIHTIISTALNT